MWSQRISHLIDSIKVSPLIQEPLGTSNQSIHLTPHAVSQLNHLKLNTSQYLPGFTAGTRASIRRRPAFDFREHRTYVPGDDVRYVDWKASARQEHIFIKQGEYPKEASVHILLDCSRSMDWGNPRKHDSARRLTAALGYTALSQGDRLIIQPMSSKSIQHLGPISGKGQVPTMLNYLQNITCNGHTDLTEGVKGLTKRTRGGLVLIISDLLDVSNLDEAIGLVPVPTWDVLVIHLLNTEEVNPTIQGNFKMVDIETGETANYDINQDSLNTYMQRLDSWQDELEIICNENNSFYSLIQGDWSLEQRVIPHLRSLNILVPA